jgi:hypothetical protein
MAKIVGEIPNEPIIRQHAGTYRQQKAAEEYAAFIRSTEGKTVEVNPVTYWEVIVVVK